MKKSEYEKYIESPVYYQDGLLVSSLFDNISVMSDHEDLIMRESAKIICQNGGKILNVGFGMGIIDSYIRDLNPDQHVIIEAHPTVVKKAISMGFDQSATIYHGDWRDVVQDLIKDGIKFNGIYFDTIIVDWNRNEWLDFANQVDQILEVGGIFAYFNHTAAKLTPTLVDVLKSYNYDQFNTVIPFKHIVDSVEGDFNKKLLENEDYNLLYYIKK